MNLWPANPNSLGRSFGRFHGASRSALDDPLDSTQDELTVACRQQYRTLLEVAEAIVSHRDLQALFHDLAGRLRQVVHFDYLNPVWHEAASLLRHQAEASCD